MAKEAVREKAGKSDNLHLDIDLDQYGRKQEDRAFFGKFKWESKLLEINGQTLKLRHKHIEENESTINFEFNKKSIPLGNGITLEPDQSIGQVSAYGDSSGKQESRGLMFFSPGGKLKFAPQNLQYTGEQTAELAMVHIILPPAPQKDQAVSPEISAYLRDPISIEPLAGFRMELGQGEYVKRAAEPDTTLKFPETKIYHQDMVVAEHIQTETDKDGLHFVGLDGVSVKLDPSISPLVPTGEEGSIPAAKFLLEDNGAALHISVIRAKQDSPAKEATAEKQIAAGTPTTEETVIEEAEEENPRHFDEYGLTVGQATFHLKNALQKDRKLVNAKSGWVLFHGFSLQLENVTVSGDETYLQAEKAEVQDWQDGDHNPIDGKLQRISFDGSVMSAKEGNISLAAETIHMEGISLENGRLLLAEKGKGILNDKDTTLTKIKLDIDLMLRAEEASSQIERYPTAMKGYSYRKRSGFSYESATVNTGMHLGLDAENNRQDQLKDIFSFTLGGAQYLKEDFGENTEAEGISLNQKANNVQLFGGGKREYNKLEEKIFTRDGFVELETAVFDFRKNGNDSARIVGKGDFHMQDIPYTIDIEGDQLTGVAKAPDDPARNIEFAINSSGNLEADFGDDNAQGFNLSEINGKENKSESIVYTAELGGITINDGFLKASELRVDRGLKIEQEMDEDKSKALKRLFNCSVTGTIATSGTDVSMDTRGIHAKEGKTTLGQLQVEGFLGFLSGKVDYPGGSFEVSAKTTKETEENPGFLDIKSEKLKDKIEGSKNLGGDGIRIPIVGPLALIGGIAPSASIAGSVTIAGNRGKSFGAPWERSDSLGVEGAFVIDGSAGVEAFLGLALDGLIASADVRLTGGISAELGARLTVKTAIGLDPAETQRKKLKMVDNLTFEGELSGNLTAEAALSGNVHILFWKAQLFNIQLAEKELGKLTFSGSGFKDYNKPGLREGWNLEKMEFTAESIFGKTKTNLEKMKFAPQGAVELDKDLEADIKTKGENVKNAWAALTQLQENQKNVLYAVTKAEKKALEAQIADMKKKTEGLLIAYRDVLTQQQRAREKAMREAEWKVAVQQKAIETSQENLGLRNPFIAKAMEGGFNDKSEKYRFDDISGDLSKSEKAKAQKANRKKLKRAAVDLAIAKVLAEAPDMEHLKKEFETEKAEGRENDFDLFLAARTSFLQSKEMDKKQAPSSEELQDQYGGYMQYANYWFMLETPVLQGTRKLSQVPKEYRAILEEKPDMLGKELLQMMLNDEDAEKDTTPMRNMLRFLAEAPQKAEGGVFSGMQAYKDAADQALFGEIDKYYQPMFGAELDQMVKGGNTDYFGQIFRPEELLKDAELKATVATAELEKATALLDATNTKLKECNEKLAELMESAKTAIQDKSFQPAAAKTAVDIYKNDYLGKMDTDENIAKAINQHAEAARPLPAPANV